MSGGADGTSASSWAHHSECEVVLQLAQSTRQVVRVQLVVAKREEETARTLRHHVVCRCLAVGPRHVSNELEDRVALLARIHHKGGGGIGRRRRSSCGSSRGAGCGGRAIAHRATARPWCPARSGVAIPADAIFRRDIPSEAEAPGKRQMFLFVMPYVHGVYGVLRAERRRFIPTLPTHGPEILFRPLEVSGRPPRRRPRLLSHSP